MKREKRKPGGKTTTVNTRHKWGAVKIVKKQWNIWHVGFPVMKVKLKQDFLWAAAVNKALSRLFILTPLKSLLTQHIQLQPCKLLTLISQKYDDRMRFRSEITTAFVCALETVCVCTQPKRMHVCVCVFSFCVSNKIHHMKKNLQHGKNVSNCVDPISCWPAVSEPITTQSAMGSLEKNQRPSTN